MPTSCFSNGQASRPRHGYVDTEIQIQVDGQDKESSFTPPKETTGHSVDPKASEVVVSLTPVAMDREGYPSPTRGMGWGGAMSIPGSGSGQPREDDHEFLERVDSVD